MIFGGKAIVTISEAIAPYQGPSTDMSFEQTLTGKLIVGVHDCCPVDTQFFRQGSLGG